MFTLADTGFYKQCLLITKDRWKVKNFELKVGILVKLQAELRLFLKAKMTAIIKIKTVIKNTMIKLLKTVFNNFIIVIFVF